MKATSTSDPWLINAVRHAEEMAARNLSEESVKGWRSIVADARACLKRPDPPADESPVHEPEAPQDGASGPETTFPEAVPASFGLPRAARPAPVTRDLTGPLFDEEIR